MEVYVQKVDDGGECTMALLSFQKEASLAPSFNTNYKWNNKQFVAD